MNTFDIACFGTSLTFGSGTAWNGTNVSNGGSWITYLERALQPGKRSEIRCYNFGYPGWNVIEGKAEAYKVALLRPSFVTIEFSMNDVGEMSIETCRSETRSVIEQIKAASPHSKIALMTMNPVVNAPSRSNVGAYYELYREMSRLDENLLLIDSNFTWGPGNREEIPDGIHPLLAVQQAKLVPAIVSVVAPLIR